MKLWLDPCQEESGNVWLEGEEVPSVSQEIFNEILFREAFKKYLQKSYGIFHMLVDPPTPPNIGKFAIFFYVFKMIFSYKGKNKSV